MGIIGNIQNRIVEYINQVFLCNLGSGEFFPNNIHRAKYYFNHSKKTEKPNNTTVLPLGGSVYCKRPPIHTLMIFFLTLSPHSGTIKKSG
jgi:hypothetical protein